jgi:hypothetical protein
MLEYNAATKNGELAQEEERQATVGGEVEKKSANETETRILASEEKRVPKEHI